ncbi:MAG: hypothetical protein PF480_15440, partial [Roseovarius sp.]|nr:hypothetical protein [Roseovarius sp.]
LGAGDGEEYLDIVPMGLHGALLCKNANSFWDIASFPIKIARLPWPQPKGGLHERANALHQR